MSPSPEERVAEAFNAYFANFDISIRPEDVAVGSGRTIGERGWRIAYRGDPDDAGLPSMEFYATHRMTNDRHERIWADGHVEHLDAIHEVYGWDPKVPASKQAAKEQYLKHNQAVARQLRERGLYPDGDINAFLRTGGAELDEGSGKSAGRQGDGDSP